MHAPCFGTIQEGAVWEELICYPSAELKAVNPAGGTINWGQVPSSTLASMDDQLRTWFLLQSTKKRAV